MATGDGAAGESTRHELAGLARELMQIMREGGLTSLRIKQGELSVALEAQQPGAAPAGAAQPTASGPAPAPTAATAQVEQVPGFVITAPMIGTFYAAAGPGEGAFVEVGQEVAAGETVGIIEAMKIMNEIVAERAGVVVEIFVGNGETVEFGHPLMRLREV